MAANMSPYNSSPGDSAAVAAIMKKHFSRDAELDTKTTYTLLTGKRLVNVLDTMDHHHVLLKHIFTTQQDPFEDLRAVFKSLCQKLCENVSPEVEKLFVTSSTKEDNLHFDYQTRRRVWDSIYKRIEAPIGNPYRFTNISSHRHVRLDDQVRSLLSEEVKNKLPTNMDGRDGSLPKKVQASAPDRTSSRSATPSSDRVIPGSYANDDIIHSPTAQATTRPRAPMSEVYDSPPQGELRRPTKIGGSTRRAQESNHRQSKRMPLGTQPQTPENRKPLKHRKSHRLQDSDCQSDNETPSTSSTTSVVSVVDTTSDDTDWDEYANVASQHREDCSLCRHYKIVNTLVTDARAASARGLMSKKQRKNATLLAAARVRDFERVKDLMKKWGATKDPAYDPADTRLWSEIADLMYDLLCENEQAEKKAMADLLENFRVTTFVPEDRDNHYYEENHLACPIVKELQIALADFDLNGTMPEPQRVIQPQLTDKMREDMYTSTMDELKEKLERKIEKQDMEQRMKQGIDNSPTKSDDKEGENTTINEDDGSCGFWEEEEEELDLELFQ